MKALLCLLVLVGLTPGESYDTNIIADQLLKQTNDVLSKLNNGTVPLASLYEKCFYGLLIPGHIECCEGYIHGLADLKRYGDISMTTKENSTTLKFFVGLDNLEMGYHACRLTVAGLYSQEREVLADIPSGSLSAEVTISRDGKVCTASLENLALISGEIFFGALVYKSGGIIHAIYDVDEIFLLKVIDAIDNELRRLVQAYAESEKFVTQCFID